jgi:hypothetical protein
MRKKIAVLSLIVIVAAICILNAQTILSFLSPSPYKKVTVVEGQITIVDFDDKSYNLWKEGKNLYVGAQFNLPATYTPSQGAVYHWHGIEIVVSEIYEDWFVLFVKPEWK